MDYEGAFVAATGGLRLSYATHVEAAALAKLHAGDSVSVLTQAKLPQMFRDEGAFDRRAYLEQQGIDLVATLRAPELLEVTKPARPGISGWTSRARRALGDEIDALWATEPRVAGVLRAMLLGDRSFVERDEAIDFQKTGAFHVLVVAGLHVGAFAVTLFWIGRRLRLPRLWTAGPYAADATRLCECGGTARAGAACGIDGCDRSDWRIFLSAVGAAEFRSNRGIGVIGDAAARFAMRVFNCRFWRLGVSRGWRFRGWKARCSRTRGRYRMAGRYPGCRAGAASDAITNRSAVDRTRD